MLLTWKEQFWDCNLQLRIVSLSIFERILKLQSSPNASYRALLYKTSPWEGLYHFWGIAFHGDWSYSGGISEIYFDQLDDIQTKSKWLKSCFGLGIMRVCCVLLIRLITMKETCNHLFLFAFLERGGEEESRCWGSVKGSDMQVTRMVSTLYITIRLTVSLKAWSGGRSGRQSFVSLVAPSFWLNGFAL